MTVLLSTWVFILISFSLTMSCLLSSTLNINLFCCFFDSPSVIELRKFQNTTKNKKQGPVVQSPITLILD